jgi:pyruvate, water dikinase
LAPDWLVHLKQATGLVTEQGGMTSHGAIVARELGIPAVVGATDAMRLIQSGDVVLLDGDRGELYRVIEPLLATVSAPIAAPTAAPIAAPDNASQTSELEGDCPAPRPTANGTPLLVNLSQLDALPQVATLAIDGVGLLRAELLLMDVLGQNPGLQHPGLLEGDRAALSDRLAHHIRQFAQAFAPRPVFYRSLDLRAHEYRSLLSHQSSSELHPILGRHGTLSYQTDPNLFDAELAALRQVQQSGYSNVRLILPFVRTVEEFSFCRDRVLQAGLTQNPHFQLWIMAEVPSVLFLLPDYVKAGVQGISIGSNDLTQLLLAIDRDDPQLATAYDQQHPAVLRAIHHLIQQAHQVGIPCSICGQAPSQFPDLINSLVRWGITSISVDPPAVEQTLRAIARAEQQLLLEAARRD